MAEGKIIQIIPAPVNLRSISDENQEEEIVMEVVCIALKDTGEVVLMDMDGLGEISEVREMRNFSSIRWV